MKKPANQRSTVFVLIESFVWILASLYARHLVDLAVGRWQIGETWGFLLKVGVVLVLIGIAVWLHNVLFRWLGKRGLLPDERPE
jgi:hypothetical protein